MPTHLLNQKEQLKQSFVQDPISIIQNLLNREQKIKDDLAFLKEKQKAQESVDTTGTQSF